MGRRLRRPAQLVDRGELGEGQEYGVSEKIDASP